MLLFFFAFVFSAKGKKVQAGAEERERGERWEGENHDSLRPSSLVNYNYYYRAGDWGRRKVRTADKHLS